MMPVENKTCQNCEKDFVIEPEDFNFYKKMDVPAPTWCHRCRNIRRLSWREFQTFYKRNCDLCGKGTMSIQPPQNGFKVYCRECYQSDNWDAAEYGRDYDFSRPFFEQYKDLMRDVPWPAVTGNNLVNSDYSHACMSCKNCYLNTWSYFSEDSQYSYALLSSRNCFDCYVADNSDHVYESINVDRMFRAAYAYSSDDCLDSYFLYDCVGCSDCFGGVNLRKKKYVLFNEQLSKEKYQKDIKEWDFGSYAKTEEAKRKFRELYLSIPHKYNQAINAVNCTGDLMRNARNCKVCLSILDGVENSKYIYGAGLNLKDSFDCTSVGDTAAMIYESVSTTKSERIMFSSGGKNSHDVQYSNFSSFSDLFGCVALKNKQYCILNKQYSKEEYFDLLSKIRKHMDDMPYVDKIGRVYRYGEFFSPDMSIFGYNCTTAMLWYPISKEEALARGWNWQDPIDKGHVVSKKAEDLPDHIKDADDGLLKEIIGCLHGGKCNDGCTKAFRFTPQELSFYREMNFALPRLCPECRFAERFEWRNKYDLYKRQCMCQGSICKSNNGKIEYKNTSSHGHGFEACKKEFETAYPPDSPEMIYCEECYKAEFL